MTTQATFTAPATCYFCPRVLGTLADGDTCLVNGNHWTGTDYIRVDLCAGCFDAGCLASHPRQPRRQRQAVMGDWGMAVLLSNPGARKARRTH